LPSVKGQPARAAAEMLTHLGFKLAYDTTRPTARVDNQAPEPGWHPAGAAVRLTITAQPTEKVKVPDYRGVTLEGAQVEAKKFNLEVHGGKRETVATRPTKDPKLADKTVIDTQHPAAGEMLEGKKVIEVTLIRLTAPTSPPSTNVKVPDFRGETLEAAQS